MAKGEIKTNFIKETANFFVIKDIEPVSPVHLLIISKKHFRSIMEASPEKGLDGSEVFGIIASIARENGADKDGFRIVVNTGNDGGQTVDHFHMHFIAGRPFGWPPG